MVAELRDRVPPVIAIDTELARRHLGEFVRQAWHVIEPGTTFIPNWHIDAICEHLEAILSGQIRNLLINMPPRMMKSLTVSVFFPAWAWINRPELRFLYSSYAQSLATDHSVATRRVIESDWYQERWGHVYQLAGDQNLKTRFDNTARGYRYATGVGGLGTGLGGDSVICDDPHNVKHAESDAVRESTLEWWDKTMSTRLNDPKTGAKIIVMQRVHEKDLSGHVLAQGGYDHLCLPMEFEPKAVHTTRIGWRDPRTEPGELLAAERFGPAEVAEAKTRLGTYGYAGQMQQRPAPAEGGVLKTPWWRRYTELPVDQITQAIITVDSAFKEGVGSDFSVFALWGATADPKAYLIRVWRDRVEFPGLIRMGYTAHASAKETLPGLVSIPLVVEDKASGQSAIQQWKADGKLPVIAFPIPAGSSKQSRVDAIAPAVEAGQVWIPKHADWLGEWLLEHERFPKGDHDDQCFVAGTMVATTKGDRPIETIRPGDRVLTPSGTSLVSAAGCTGVRPVVTVGPLTGTPNHPVFDKRYGFVRMDTTSMALMWDNVTLGGLIQWRYRRLLYSMARPTGSWDRDAITLASQLPMRGGRALRDFTSRSGNMLMAGRFRSAARFITATAILSITSLAIWSAYRFRTIGRSINSAIQTNSVRTWSRFGRRLPSGTEARLAANGTERMPSVRGSVASRFFENAINAAVHMLRAVQTHGSVPQYVETSFGGDRRNLAFVRLSASSVATPSKPLSRLTRIASPKRAADHVAANSGRSTLSNQPVYNLTVEGDGAYYANGVLVSNCDTTAMALSRLIKQHTTPRAPVVIRQADPFRGH